METINPEYTPDDADRLKEENENLRSFEREIEERIRLLKTLRKKQEEYERLLHRYEEAKAERARLEKALQISAQPPIL
jgi:predicted nuclease with TOPRIM domain